MKSYLFLAILCLSTAASAENLVIQPGDSKAGSLHLVVTGTAGGAAEELLGYFEKGGGQQGLIWGWKKKMHEEIFSFFMTVQPNEVKSLNLQATMSPIGQHGSTQAKVRVPDGASALLYDLMLKSGVTAQPNDASKTLYGTNVICWGFHGHPGGQTTLNPTCEVTVR